MKSLSEIKDEVAFKNVFTDWEEIAELYASQYKDKLSACEKEKEELKATIQILEDSLFRLNNR